MALCALPVLNRAVGGLEAKVLGTMLPRLAGLSTLVCVYLLDWESGGRTGLPLSSVPLAHSLTLVGAVYMLM